MESVIEKISKYEFVNFFIAGSLCVFLLDKLLFIKLLTDQMIINACLIYIIGMISSRIGSLIVEPLYKKIHFVNYVESSLFWEAEKKDSKITTLSEINNLFRTCIGVSILFFLVLLYVKIESWVPLITNYVKYIVPFLLLVLFSFSYRKQTSYIKNKVEETLNIKTILKETQTK